MATTLQQQTYLRTAGSIDILLGIWLVIAPFMLGYSAINGALWNDIISGVLVIIFAAFIAGRTTSGSQWSSWVNLLLGVWLILAPFALGHAAVSAAMWNEIISGIIIIALSAYAAFSTTDNFEDRV